MKWTLLGVLLIAACSGGSADPGTTTSVSPSTTSTTMGQTTTTAPPPDCPAAPYELTVLPVGVGQGTIDTTLEPDVWTSVPGTNTTFVPRGDDTVAIALIRGTLPAVDWPAEKGEVSIDGTRAVVGPHPDGTWVAGWYEEPGERCDQYTMVFYPPWNPADVEDALAGMNRVGG
ncbi:MAG TPA: hypothetical protein VF115_14060 [Acidimicrobiia bacterium]